MDQTFDYAAFESVEKDEKRLDDFLNDPSNEKLGDVFSDKKIRKQLKVTFYTCPDIPNMYLVIVKV